MLTAHARSALPDLRLEYDAFGRPVRVLLGPLDLTPLVARVQTNTTIGCTTTEVVLVCRTGPRPPAPPIDPQEIPLQ